MALNGKGFFIWKIPDCEGGDAKKIATEAKAAGLSHILIKIANGIYTYNYDWTNHVDLVPPVAKALRAVGIQVWGWHYVYGDNPIGEADIAIKRIKELNLDGYVIDAESQYKDPGKAAAARTFMTRLRKGIGNNVPVALSSYRYPSYHPIPWNEFLEKCDYNMPQVYWIHAHNPGEQLARTIKEYESPLIKYNRPMIPVGAAFTEWGWKPTAAEVHEFLTAARSFNLSAANFWAWHNCRDILTPKHEIWNTIADFKWDPGPPPPPDITQRYIFNLNKHDVERVANLYKTTAVHVTSARTIVGIDKIKSWHGYLLKQILPQASFKLTGYSGTGNSRHFTWTAKSDSGTVSNGSDTFGLADGKIAYHYSYFTVT
ncbi:MAG: nuclear transport factor 2 family protein [Chloroflexota bacterium]